MLQRDGGCVLRCRKHISARQVHNPSPEDVLEKCSCAKDQNASNFKIQRGKNDKLESIRGFFAAVAKNHTISDLLGIRQIEKEEDYSDGHK